VRLILAVEADLKPNAAVGWGDWIERDWLDFAVIEPGSDLVQSVAEGSWLPFHAHDKGGIERHIALLPLPVRREREDLSVGAASLAGRTNEVRYRTFHRWR
jgi:hypothetical protein